MGQALYRKYRSKSLSEIVGQDHIITTLKNALKQGKISHAYLFTGPRGVGKTSIARILAHEINELPYTEESVHLDIIEIDAASNRRIDEIRDLRDKVHIAPSSAQYKVYIIDEVHMLTREAFNALLKTLEEPPAHVIFILATTEVHKLPETIVSRTQRYTFRAIDQGKAVDHLRDIAKKEKITVSDEALELIAIHGDGSFRDSISLLDQVSNRGDKIEVDDIRQMLGIAPQAAIEGLYGEVYGGTPQTILAQLTALQEQGYEANHIARQLGSLVRNNLVDGKSQGISDAVLLKALIEVPTSSDPTSLLEVTLLEVNLKNGAPEPETPKATVVAPAPKIEQKASKPAAKQPEEPKAAAPAAETPAPAAPVTPTKDFAEAWDRTLNIIKTTQNTLYGVLRMAEPRQEDGKVVLACSFAFHQKRLNEAKNRSMIADVLSQQLGSPVEVTCIVEAGAKPPTASSTVETSATPEPAPQAPAPALDTISNIFGAAEVLES